MAVTIVTISGSWGGKPYVHHVSRRHWWDPDITSNPAGELGWDRSEALDALNEPSTEADRPVKITVYPGGRRFARKAARAYREKGFRPTIVYRD